VADLSERIEELLAAANRDLMGAVGDSSLCAVSRSGDRVDGVKYLEGRTSALRELRRKVGDEGAAAVDSVAAEWQRQLDRVQERDMGPDWLAYRAGGVDVLAELR
jgi:hypothetical protein